MFKKILYVLGGLLFIAAIMAVVGLGIWAYRLNTQLAQVRTDYQALKSDYNKLDAEYSRAKEEFKVKSNQAEADLNDTEAQVTKLESDVQRLQSENNRLRTKMTKIQDSVAMLSDFWFKSDSVFERRLNASEDQQLKELYAKLQESQQWGDLVDLMSYMIQSINDASNVSWQPTLVVESTVRTGIVH